MAEPDFDVALDNGLRYGWLQFCTTAETMEIILRSQAFALETRPVETRFELASRLESIDAANFLKWVGLNSSDPMLAVLRNSKGKTVLHVIAHHLRIYSAWSDKYSRDIQGWLDLGVTVLKNGADPSSVAEQDGKPWLTSPEILETENGPSPRAPGWSPRETLYTPLLLGLAMIPYYGDFGHPECLKHKLPYLRLWSKMVQCAGLDLCDYGASESEFWRSIVGRLSDSGSGYTPFKVELLYGATPEEWSFQAYHTWSNPLYRLQPPPGAFPESPWVPSTIAWLPTQMEEDEGPWTLVEDKQHITNDGDITDLIQHSTEPFEDLMDSYQDDAGVIMLMQYSASRRRSTKARSHSEPPCLRRKELGDCERQESWRWWLPPYHFCPELPSWRFGWTGGCVKGIHTACSSVQQSRNWHYHSFLAEIADCQNDVVCTGSTTYHHPRCRWPAGCRNFHLERLNVPEDLRDDHPRRRYFPNDEDNGENGGSVEG
ncbi:hypothetical protein A1O7_07232 [Cladophialophora yegresii CBS 114405]|uniref:Uncharacterized protein n=1 Tax=Cladophialophora yegresii CBS 114405 TaxID=1182544 RepID=W9VMY6_9EURO|nr:uncharacterized protein A1O7_07232 [Cladophialophora yegresii CBS 114405]EXJ56888.1 hypothetical protein A1O7_07232 [Cladophialophora yegresii CBS 114405]